MTLTHKHRVALWISGSLLLLIGNVWRDLRHLAKKYTWEPVEIKTIHQSVSNAGVMEAIRVVEMKSDVTEVVEKKWVKEGEAVKKGQRLLELSRTQTQLEFEQTRNSYLNAESDYKKVSRELEVQRKLLKNLAVSRSQVEETAQAKEKAKAALEIAAKQLDIVRQRLDGTVVRSPMDGVVLKDFTKLGDKLSPGKEMITVGDISKFIVRTKVDELDIQQVHSNQAVEIQADAYPGKIMKGIVEQVASQAEREAFAKVEVIINITDPGEVNLKHNLSVRVHILTEEIPNAIGVPLKSIFKKKGDRGWVVVRNKLNLINEKKIVLGRIAGEKVEVISGLKPGMSVGLESVGETNP